MPSVALYTLGCKLNFAESSTLGRQMQDAGFQVRGFHEPADVYVINTCSVTDHADKKCRKVVKQALRVNPAANIVVVGCYAQLKPREISEIPGVSLVLGAAEKFNLAKHVLELASEDKGKGIVKAGPIKELSGFNTSWSIGERTRTFLKVQDGCDYSCSFCTIPLARGSSRSDTISSVVKNANAIADHGVSEVVLTGVNLGDFGLRNGTDAEESFLQLIRALENTAVHRYRISSIEPNLLTPEVIAHVANSKKFAPHFHIPLQSGSDKILRAMRRRYARALYADRVRTIKNSIPHCCIGVDVITGFPGETEEDFLDTYRFLQDLDISYLHVFTYSERPNTHALTLEDPVPVALREERTTQLRSLSEKKRRRFYAQHTGTEREVVFEEETDGNYLLGFTDNYIRVKTHYDPLLINEPVKVLLGETDAEGHVFAHAVSPLEISGAIMIEG